MQDCWSGAAVSDCHEDCEIARGCASQLCLQQNPRKVGLLGVTTCYDLSVSDAALSSFNLLLESSTLYIVK